MAYFGLGSALAGMLGRSSAPLVAMSSLPRQALLSRAVHAGAPMPLGTVRLPVLYAALLLRTRMPFADVPDGAVPLLPSLGSGARGGAGGIRVASPAAAPQHSVVGSSSADSGDAGIPPTPPSPPSRGNGGSSIGGGAEGSTDGGGASAPPTPPQQPPHGSGSGGGGRGGVGSGGAGSGVADSGGVGSGGAVSGGADSGGADSGGADSGGASIPPTPPSPPSRGNGGFSGSDGGDGSVTGTPATPPSSSARGIVGSGGGSGGSDGGGGGSRAWAWWNAFGRHPLTTALVGSALTAVAAALGYLYMAREKQSQVQVAAQFHARRLEAVKARILHGPGSAESSAPAGSILHRPAALKALDGLDADAGLYMLVAPKGEGKSTLVAQWAATRPHVILVDVGTSENLNDAVRAVAAELGYDMQYSEKERAAVAAGFTLPDLSGPQGEGLFLELLRVYGLACRQLASSGALRGRFSVLILDQATRPLYGPAGRTGGSPLEGGNLIYATVNYGHYFANKHVATLALVTSDPLMEADTVWRKASGRDSLRFRRIPAFSEEEAASLLALRVFAGLSPDQRTELLGVAPSAADGSLAPELLATVKKQYSSSIAFVLAAVGTRARWLSQLVSNENAATLLANEDLPTRGVRIPEVDLPFLPSEFAADTRVDAGVLHSFESLVEERRMVLSGVLELPSEITLPPQLSTPPSPENMELRRVLATDAALRDLLASSAPLKYNDVRAHFPARQGDLLRLGAAHVVYYNHDGKTLELESELMRRVVAAQLGSAEHVATIGLARALLAWQEASMVKAEAEKNAELWTRGASTKEKEQGEKAAPRAALAAAQKAVAELEKEIKVKRGEMAAGAKKKRATAAR